MRIVGSIRDKLFIATSIKLFLFISVAFIAIFTRLGLLLSLFFLVDDKLNRRRDISSCIDLRTYDVLSLAELHRHRPILLLIVRSFNLCNYLLLIVHHCQPTQNVVAKVIVNIEDEFGNYSLLCNLELLVWSAIVTPLRRAFDVV